MSKYVYMTYIGEDGSMGLEKNRIYRVKIFTRDDFIWVQWRYLRSFSKPRSCPYETIEALSANWKSYETILYKG